MAAIGNNEEEGDGAYKDGPGRKSSFGRQNSLGDGSCGSGGFLVIVKVKLSGDGISSLWVYPIGMALLQRSHGEFSWLLKCEKLV